LIPNGEWHGLHERVYLDVTKRLDSKRLTVPPMSTQ
jgi:hypothetical protein